MKWCNYQQITNAMYDMNNDLAILTDFVTLFDDCSPFTLLLVFDT